MKKKFINGKIYVEKGKFAEAMYLENNMIKKVGSNQEINKLEANETVDLKGRTLVPGMNDSHMHLYITGNALTQLQLNGSKSIEEVIERGKEYIKNMPESETFVYGRGWNQELFTSGEKRALNRHDLDKISTEYPIIAERVCVHVVSLNSKAIEILGLDKEEEIEGGEIYKDEKGEPLGIYTEKAAIVARSIVPEDSPEDIERKFLVAADHAIKCGLTSVQSTDIMMADHWNPTFSVLQGIYQKKKTPLRYYPQFNFNSLDVTREYIEEVYKSDFFNDTFQRGAIKVFKDASLGARTAFLSQPYHDDSNVYGVEAISREEMDEICAFADKNNIQVLTHAIGNEAIRRVLDSYEKILRKGKNPLRHGIVHCEITDLPLLERIAKLNIGTVYQPVFLESDIPILEDRVGPLASTSYAFNTLYNKLGAHTSYSTDSPVEDLNPFSCIYAAVTRQQKDGNPEGGFFSEEKVSVEDAIDCYTYESAYMQNMEDRLGRIKSGYLADFLVLDRDIFTIDPKEIKNIQVLETYIDGKLVYKKLLSG